MSISGLIIKTTFTHRFTRSLEDFLTIFVLNPLDDSYESGESGESGEHCTIHQLTR